MKPRSSFQTKVLTAFTAAVLVVGGLTLATWKLAQDTTTAANWVTHTQEVLDKLIRARSDALQIELSTQNFRLTDNPAYLAERDATIASREAMFLRIKQLTADNPRQQERWTQLRQVTDERIAISRRTELLRRTQGEDAARAYVATAPLQETRERMYQVLSEMEAEERRLLERRHAELSRSQQATVAAGALVAFLLLALLAATYVLIRRQVRETEASRRALAQSEEGLSITLHSIGDAVLATDTEGRVTRMNPVAERLTGWPLAQARGRAVEEVFHIIHEQTRAPAEVPVAKVLASGEVQGLVNHTVLIARDGVEWPIGDSAAPIRDADGGISGVVLVFRDVSIERQAECMIREQNALLEQRVNERTAQLRESEERFRLLIDGAKDYAIIMLDPQGRVVTWNEGARRLKGYAEAEILGQPMECFYPPEDVAAGKPARLRAQAVAEGRCEDDGWRVRKGGARFYADVILTTIREPAGKVIGFAKVTRDITAKRRVESLDALHHRVLMKIVDRRPLAEVLEHLVREIEQITPGVLGSILLLDADGIHLRCGAAPSLPEAYNRAIDGAAVGPKAGSCGTAVWRREPVIVTDIETDPLWADYRGLAQAHGLRACWSTPILNSERKVLGTFAMYFREPGAPLPEHQELIDRVTSLATLTIERIRAEEKIQTLNIELEHRVRELELTARALRTLSAGNHAMLHATDEAGLLDHMCRAIVDAGGYHMALVWYHNGDPEKTLRATAECGYPANDSAPQLQKSNWVADARGGGVVAMAIRSGQTKVVQNMLTDPNYAAGRQSLHGNACGLACPLRVDGEVIGALAIYATEPYAFGGDEVTLLTESADDLSFGIATLRARAAQRQTQETLLRMTRYDRLTGLPNEAHFAELMSAAIDTGRQVNHSFALLQTNIDRLSEINDLLGFSSGDQLLREFGSRLGTAVPSFGLVARLRADEFAVLLPDADANAAIALARRLEEVLREPFLITDIPIDVAVKIGIALFPGHGETPHDLFRHMDMALQQAKQEDTRHEVFDPARNRMQPNRLRMTGELRRAIENGDELRLYLQPKVEIATGLVRGAEGLVRWQHAERGLIPPSEFIGLAEHTGLIKPLTEWVIDTALRLNHAWLPGGHAMPLAINISARNLRDEDLLETIRLMQATWGVPVGLLELEVTESMVMRNPEFALRVLHGLREQGIPLYIDDFGTGYSSLSYLQKLPVDYLKIDQSFVRAMTTDDNSLPIVRATIDLAHDLGRKVVAEGVETREHWDRLAALGCDIAQGYFLAKPMPADEFPAWVSQFRPPASVTAG